MNRLARVLRLPRVALGMAAIFVALLAWAASPSPASARVWVDIGVPFPGYYAPWPYYPPPYYPYYAPPPPPPAYYPPPPAAYAPPAPAVGAPTSPAAAPASASITYTSRPAFRNAAGQTCREFRAADGALGTACRDASGQWRVQQ